MERVARGRGFALVDDGRLSRRELRKVPGMETGHGVQGEAGTDASQNGSRVVDAHGESMNKRKLGTQGLIVTEQGLGCMGMSEFYGETDEVQSIATLNRAIELGVDFFDTSDMYGPYKNEELLGKAFRGRRAEVIIATKFGIQRDPTSETGRSINGRPEYVHEACEGSLKRLGIDCIDLYYQHRVDPKTPVEETVGAMAELVREGKV